MVLLIYPDVDIWRYMVGGIDDKDVVCRPLNPSCNKFQLIVRKLLNENRLPGFMLFGNKLRQELKSLGAGDTVLISDYTDLCLFKSINAIVSPETKKCLWIWNPVKPHERGKMRLKYQAIEKQGFEISTFDKGDAERYHHKLYNQLFRMEQDITEVKDEYDFYFVGYEKGRGNVIKLLEEQLKNYRTYFHVVHNPRECITYLQNIENIKKSKCIIEIVQEGQRGMTLRPLEAMAFGKKLLTNNKEIVSAPFYNKNNIFVLGIDDIDSIDRVLITPYVLYEDLHLFDVNCWISNYK